MGLEAKFRTSGARKPLRTLVLPPTSFACEWEKRPTDNIVVGLRLLSESDDQQARILAAQAVVRFYTPEDSATILDEEAAAEAYNDAIFELAVARGICDPNDAAKAHPLFPFAEAQVPTQFTPAGIRFVWDHLARLKAEVSPLVRPVDDAELEEVARRLAGIRTLTGPLGVSARKLLGAVLAMLPEETPAAPPEDVAIYEVHAHG